MNIFNNKMIIILVLSIILIYSLLGNNKSKNSIKKTEKAEETYIKTIEIENNEQQDSNIIKTGKFVLYNNNKLDKNIDFGKRYLFLKNINKEKQKKIEEEKRREKIIRHERYRNYIKKLKEKTNKENSERVNDKEIEDNSDWVRDNEIEDDSEWDSDNEVQYNQGLVRDKEVLEKTDDIKSNLSQLSNNYPKFDKRFEEIYNNKKVTLLEAL